MIAAQRSLLDALEQRLTSTEFRQSVAVVSDFRVERASVDRLTVEPGEIVFEPCDPSEACDVLPRLRMTARRLPGAYLDHAVEGLAATVFAVMSLTRGGSR